jgi:hypothetical protein
VATVTSASVGQSAVQAGWQQFRLQQAQRTADQAEQEAQSLRAQAANAERSANRAQENARSLAADADRAEGDAGRARLGLATLETSGRMKTALASTVQQVVTKEQVQQTTQASTPTQPVTNAQGQVTGTLVNVAA